MQIRVSATLENRAPPGSARSASRAHFLPEKHADWRCQLERALGRLAG
jgi:hypothetical protein